MNEASFLKRCKQSSHEASQAFKELLSDLETPFSRPTALKAWHQLARKLMEQYSPEELLQQFHFSLSVLILSQEGGQQTRLHLLQLPSTFAPENWSFTFFEGLSRFKPAEFQDRLVAELGCGIGWITLALAKQTKVAKIYGLDINPKAILCSKINLYMNAFQEDGTPSWQHEGKTLVDLVEFHQSDLLDHCRTNKIVLDRVVGCIPQVLNPDPEFASRVHFAKENELETENDEFLHSLSNYTVDQGYLEDQFGLGLIARAIEESASVLKTAGKLILNLGGRPGAQVIQQLFQRRGFTIHTVWRTQVSQAKDTDIRGLVSIEDRTSHRFEFYMGSESDTPVSAKTALAYAEAGGEIAHVLTVYESHLRETTHLPKIIQFLTHPGYRDARNAIDLSFNEDILAHEKISYLSALTEHLGESAFFAYEETAGLPQFREHLSLFFNRYFKIPWDQSSFLITPSRVATCENLLQLFRPKKALMDAKLASQIKSHPDVLEVPRNLDILCELIHKLEPELVIYTISSLEAQMSEPFQRLCEISSKHSTRIFLEISDLIELSSTPQGNGIFRYLRKHPLPPQIALVGGLVKNRLYQDLEVCFVISENQTLLKNLENIAELSYSRTPVLSQLYYDRIIQELINFQITKTHLNPSHSNRPPIPEKADFKKSYLSVAKWTKQAFAHPAIQGESTNRASGIIRLDYGENCLPTPEALKRALFEAFSKMHLPHEEVFCDPEVLQVLKTRFKLSDREKISLYYAGGVAPIFAKLVEYCAQIQAELHFPSGAYGHFVSTTLLHGVKIQTIPTQEKNSFKLSIVDLKNAIKDTPSQHPRWLILSAPIVNPTGAVYSTNELNELFGYAEKHSITLVIDSIFSGLDFSESPSTELPDISRFPNLKWVILGGISKEFAAGGLRVGYAATPLIELNSHFAQLVAPPKALKFSIKKVYHLLLQREPELLGELAAQRAELKRRADQLAKLLKKMNWNVLTPHGGLFLCAAPPSQDRLRDQTAVFIQEKGIAINPPEWTGIPHYYRFVLSLAHAEFNQALIQLFDSPA